jgi:hypothetical protein
MPPSLRRGSRLLNPMSAHSPDFARPGPLSTASCLPALPFRPQPAIPSNARFTRHISRTRNHHPVALRHAAHLRSGLHQSSIARQTSSCLSALPFRPQPVIPSNARDPSFLTRLLTACAPPCYPVLQSIHISPAFALTFHQNRVQRRPFPLDGVP